MGDGALEEVVSEKVFTALLETHGEMLFRLARTLLAKADGEWSRRHFFQLVSEADSVEAFLDDFGARHNRAYSFLRELVASLRAFALAGFSIAHLERRLDRYPTVLSSREADDAHSAVAHARAFIQRTTRLLAHAVVEEARAHGMRLPEADFPENRWVPDGPRQKLPRNMGQEELASDEQKTAELASKFLKAADLFERPAAQRITEEREREMWLQRHCSEERARVFEATVHNLQSAYDTWVKGTSIEADDPRLPRLRGHASAALHLLEAVTHLTHFVERHESGLRDDGVARRLGAIVSRANVRDVTLNDLLMTASIYMRRARSLAEDLLPTYANVQEVEVELNGDLVIHARPAALIVGIVNHHGMPVQLFVEGRACNAGSILEMMVAVGSAPDARRFLFRGDASALRDIQLLFRSDLGEHGLDRLPPELAYLRTER